MQPTGSVLELCQVVADLGPALDHWTGTIGAGPFFVFDVPVLPGQLYRGNPTEVAMKVAFGFSGGLLIELLQQTNDGPSVFREMLEESGHGYHHVMLRGPYDANFARLSARGHAVAFSGRMPSGERFCLFDTRSADGAFIELMEISSAMEESFDRYGTQPTPVKGVYSAPYEGDSRWQQVLDGVQAVERRLGRKPKLLIAKMGQDGHDRGANVIASAFGDMGFDVVSGPLFQTPDETVVLALDSGVDVVGASSLAAGHKTLIPDLIAKLREAGRNDIKVIAGGVIPPQDYDFLRDAGVQGIYGPGSNVVECAADVLRLLGHNMPPAGLEDAA